MWMAWMTRYLGVLRAARLTAIHTGNVDAKLYKYVSSVKIGGRTEYCKFYK